MQLKIGIIMYTLEPASHLYVYITHATTIQDSQYTKIKCIVPWKPGSIDNRPTEKGLEMGKIFTGVTSSTRSSLQYGEYGNENGDCSAKVPP